MYLPFDTTSAIFLGGVMKWVADRMAERLSGEKRLAFEEKGTLLASGLIAGEAIVGILLAVVFLTGIPALATFGFYAAWGGWLSLIGFVAIGYVLIRIPNWRSGD
jgi:Kef-type K+ transport system membrane component KefB